MMSFMSPPSVQLTGITVRVYNRLQINGEISATEYINDSQIFADEPLILPILWLNEVIATIVISIYLHTLFYRKYLNLLRVQR